MPDYLSVCEAAARSGGQVLRDWQGRFTSREKGIRDLVTEADLASQEAIRKILLGEFPDHDFLGEEDPLPLVSGEKAAKFTRKAEYRWIVDPLDGTSNYVHGLSMFAVSIALERAGEIIVGTVYDPVADECFSAVKGKGTTLNGKTINASGCVRVDQSLVAVSFAPNITRESPEIAWFVEALLQCQSARRLGSAALNLAYVAAGRMDAYLTTSVQIWDVAAGMLLVTEAGGVLATLHGGPLDLQKPEFLAAATPQLQHDLRNVLLQARPLGK